MFSCFGRFFFYQITKEEILSSNFLFLCGKPLIEFGSQVVIQSADDGQKRLLLPTTAQ